MNPLPAELKMLRFRVNPLRAELKMLCFTVNAVPAELKTSNSLRRSPVQKTRMSKITCFIVVVREKVDKRL